MERKDLVGAGIGLALLAAGLGMSEATHYRHPERESVLYRTFGIHIGAKHLHELLSPDSLLFDREELIDSTRRIIPDTLRVDSAHVRPDTTRGLPPDSTYLPQFEQENMLPANYRIT